MTDNKILFTPGLKSVPAIPALLCFFLIMAPATFADTFKYIAHRAHSCGTGENTLAAIKDTSTKGVKFVELDVRVSADGIAYLFHDSEAHDVNLKELMFARIRELIGSEHSPTLYDSLKILPPDTHVMLDLKNYGILRNRAVIETLKESGIAAQRVILQSENARLLVVLRGNYPDSQYFLLARLKRKPLFFRAPSAANLLDLTNALRLDGISFKGRNFIDRTYIETLKSGGAEVFVWTINDRARADAYRQAGVDGIITDYPALLADAEGAGLKMTTQCINQD